MQAQRVPFLYSNLTAVSDTSTLPIAGAGDGSLVCSTSRQQLQPKSRSVTHREDLRSDLSVETQ